MRKIAVVGAGLAGLAVSYFLLDHPNCSVTLFDPKGPGGGASGASAGLMLHPFPGKKALRSWRASEGMAASWDLIQKAQEALGAPVAERTGILRLAAGERQQADFRLRTQEDPEAIWLSTEQLLEKAPHATPLPGLWIPSGGTIYSNRYLQGLYQLCHAKGLKWESSSISSTASLQPFDQIVLAAGHETVRFAECADLPLDPTKGHTLLCRWPRREIPCSLIGDGHLCPTEDPSLCQIGSTYEHGFTDLLPHREAIDQLKKKAARFYPPAADFEVVDLRVGVRTSRPKEYRPIVERRSEKVWVFTGLGSRGLLYHALLGKELASRMLAVLLPQG